MFCLYTQELSLQSVFAQSKIDKEVDTTPIHTPTPKKKLRIFEKTQVMGTNLSLSELEDVLRSGRLSNSMIDYNDLEKKNGGDNENPDDHQIAPLPQEYNKLSASLKLAKKNKGQGKGKKSKGKGKKVKKDKKKNQDNCEG